MVEKLMVMWVVGEDDTKGRAVPYPTAFCVFIAFCVSVLYTSRKLNQQFEIVS